MREQTRAALQLDGPRRPRIRSDMIGLTHCGSLILLFVLFLVLLPAASSPAVLCHD